MRPDTSHVNARPKSSQVCGAIRVGHFCSRSPLVCFHRLLAWFQFLRFNKRRSRCPGARGEKHSPDSTPPPRLRLGTSGPCQTAVGCCMIVPCWTCAAWCSQGWVVGRVIAPLLVLSRGSMLLCMPSTAGIFSRCCSKETRRPRSTASSPPSHTAGSDGVLLCRRRV